MMGGSIAGMHKTVLPSACGRQPLPLLPASGAAAASPTAPNTTTGVSTTVDAASLLIVVFHTAASVFDAIADSR